MTWFRVDDSFAQHPKVLAIPRKDRPAAVGLWMLAGTWCAANTTDGFVPAHLPGEFGCHARQADALVTAHLWVQVDGGWRFHSGPDDQYEITPLWSIESADESRKIDPVLRGRIYRRDGQRCVACGDSEDLTIDHIHPWSKGGKTTEPNLQTLCRSCNSRKGAKV